jgi:hypothetical protein
MALTRFSPPGHLPDFKTDLQKKEWSRSVENLFSDVIATTTKCIAPVDLQFVDPMKVDTSGFTSTEISWPGFPNALFASGLTRKKAFEIADAPVTAADANGLSSKGRFTQDEYLEWFVHRKNGEIIAVDFTTETEHYWDTLFQIDKQLCASLYSELTGHNVSSAQISSGNIYNPLNVFNVERGIVHLIHPSNTLGAELDIACQSTRKRVNAQGVEIHDVVGCTRCGGHAIGGDTRNSDPKIANKVSIAAGEGRALTIPDPVGLYIARLDTKGWTTPDGSDPQACWRVVRGNPAVRARFEVPGNKFKISEIRIAGESIVHAGQIAEQVFVKLTAAGGPANQFANRPESKCRGSVVPHASAPPEAAPFSRARVKR